MFDYRMQEAHATPLACPVENHAPVFLRQRKKKEEEVEEEEVEEESDSNDDSNYEDRRLEGVPVAMCTCAYQELQFMEFCLAEIAGFQSDKIMREKIIAVLEPSIFKLSLGSSKNPSFALQSQWLQALTVVLSSLHSESYWMGWKIYGPDYMASIVALGPRVKAALSNLMAAGIFDNKDMYKVLARFVELMTLIEKEYADWTKNFDEDERKPLFKGLIQKYTPIMKAFHEKYTSVLVVSGAPSSSESASKRPAKKKVCGDSKDIQPSKKAKK